MRKFFSAFLLATFVFAVVSARAVPVKSDADIGNHSVVKAADVAKVDVVYLNDAMELIIPYHPHKHIASVAPVSAGVLPQPLANARAPDNR